MRRVSFCCPSINEHKYENIGKIEFSLIYGEKTITVLVNPTRKLDSVIQAAALRFGRCREELSFYHDGGYVREDDTAYELGIENGDYIEVHTRQVGGKPVIYLTSPTNMDATVRLSLVPAWKLSAHYPIVPVQISHDAGESIEWKVSTRCDGTLQEHTTGLDVAYLFWEAL